MDLSLLSYWHNSTMSLKYPRLVTTQNKYQGIQMITVNDSTRLRYTLIAEEHKELLFELDQDPDVMKYINGGKTTTREELDTIFIPRLNAYRNPQKGWGLWAVHTKEDNAYLGWVLVRPLHFFDENTATEYNNLELGWRFKKAAWGKGYGTEAAQAVCNAVSQPDEVTKVCALAEKENIGSTRIMEKLGMTFIKNIIYKDPLGDDEVVYYEKTL